MTCARTLACLALLLLPSCLDPLVGQPCADNFTACGSGCQVTGTCGVDGGHDLGTLDLAAGEASANGNPSLDSSASLDQSGAVDVDDGEAHAVIDSIIEVTADRAPDKTGGAERPAGNGDDMPLADARDGRADASDAVKSDASDAGRPDASDAGKSDARDAAPVLTSGARDVREARDMVDAPSTSTEAGGDRAAVRADAAEGAKSKQAARDSKFSATADVSTTKPTKPTVAAAAESAQQVSAGLVPAKPVPRVRSSSLDTTFTPPTLT